MATVTKEDVDTLKDDWLTDNVSSSGMSVASTMLIYPPPPKDDLFLGRVS